MDFINGIELVYSDFFSNYAIKIIFYVEIAVFSLMFLATVYLIIRDKEWESWWAPLALAGLGAFFCLITWANSAAYTKYYVLLDETVPYTTLVDTYGDNNIHHEGGDLYSIIIEEK